MQKIKVVLASGLALLGVSAAKDMAFAAEELPELRLTAPTQIKPIRITNESGSSLMRKIQLQQRWQVNSLGLSIAGGCNAQKQQTNIHERGVYLAKMLVGYGSSNDSFWAQQVYDGTDRTVFEFKDRVTLKIDPAFLNGSAFDVDAVKALQKIASRHSAGSKAELEFYRKDQKTQVKLPLRLEVICQQYVHDKIQNKTEYLSKWSRVLTKEIPIAVLYAGDQKLKPSTVKPLALRSVGGAGQGLQKALRIQSVQIIEGPKNMRSFCPMDVGFKVRVRGTGQGFIRLIAQTGSGQKITSEEVKFSAPLQEMGFSVSMNREVKGALYEQQLGKLFVEVQGRPKAVSSSKLYSQRQKAAPYLWQFSCIELSD